MTQESQSVSLTINDSVKSALQNIFAFSKGGKTFKPTEKDYNTFWVAYSLNQKDTKGALKIQLKASLDASKAASETDKVVSQKKTLKRLRGLVDFMYSVHSHTEVVDAKTHKNKKPTQKEALESLKKSLKCIELTEDERKQLEGYCDSIASRTASSVGFAISLAISVLSAVALTLSILKHFKVINIGGEMNVTPVIAISAALLFVSIVTTILFGYTAFKSEPKPSEELITEVTSTVTAAAPAPAPAPTTLNGGSTVTAAAPPAPTAAK